MQVHHINDDPSDNRLENLAVLCLEDHNRTQLRGGFGKHLLVGEVEKYRDAWVEKVASLYRSHDRGEHSESSTELTKLPSSLLAPYILSLPTQREALYKTAHMGWDTGITSQMDESTSALIAALEEIWIYLARFYPNWHFDRMSREHYVRVFAANRFVFHRAIYQPDGEGTAGSIIGQLSGGSVMRDLESMIGDTVEALWFSHDLDEIDLNEWRLAWSEPNAGLT